MDKSVDIYVEKSITQTPSHQSQESPLRIEFNKTLCLLEAQILAYIEVQANEGATINFRMLRDLFSKAKWGISG
jgi:hypothetical protein